MFHRCVPRGFFSVFFLGLNNTCGCFVHTFCKGTAVQQLAADWWTLGIFTWEERTPPVHQLIELVVRSYMVLTRSPAIKSGRPVDSRLSSPDPLEWCVLRWHLVAICKNNHSYITACLSSVDSLFSHLDHTSIITPPPGSLKHSISITNFADVFALDPHTAKYPS